MRLVITSVLFSFLLANVCYALEIKNPRVTTVGSILTLNYDLYGKPGERNANIKVAAVIDGERYKPGMINLLGDYGSNVPVGKNKKITWDVLKDMPAGYSGSISFEMDCDLELSNDPFNMYGSKDKVKPPIVTDATIADPKSKLIWIRSPLAIKPVNSIEGAVSVVGKMNQQKYLGFNDWRLPRKDEYDSLLKMLSLYGHKPGQSVIPYLSNVGFDITRESKFWTIDKSSLETIGKSVSVYGAGQYGGSSSSNRSGSTSYNSGSSKYSRSSGSSFSGSGSGSFAAKATATSESVYEGMDTLFIDTKDGYFYKHNGSDNVNVLVVRGDNSSELYAVNVKTEVAINP